MLHAFCQPPVPDERQTAKTERQWANKSKRLITTTRIVRCFNFTQKVLHIIFEQWIV